MIPFLAELKIRNEALYYFGLANFILAVIFLLLSRYSNIQVSGVNAWFKPFKFALSIAVYVWTIAWFIHELPLFNKSLFNVVIIVLLGFEIFYIALQASRGQLSHFNVSTPLYSLLYSGMAIAATAVTLYTTYIGIQFFTQDISHLPMAYLWAIRLGIIIFTVYALEGFVMGSRMSHTIGGVDGSTEGIPILGWSKYFGDPRIAHFIGMHALQVLPLLAYYIISDVRAIMLIAILYFLLAAFTLYQALSGKSIFSKFKRNSYELVTKR